LRISSRLSVGLPRAYFLRVSARRRKSRKRDKNKEDELLDSSYEKFGMSSANSNKDDNGKKGNCG
jgi:hypothetical protein